jgi:peptide/nickel transport system substrate-binding protein
MNQHTNGELQPVDIASSVMRAGISRRGFLRWTALATALAGVAPILAACGDDDDDDDDPDATAPPAATTAPPAATTATSGQPAATATTGQAPEATATTAQQPAATATPAETTAGSGGTLIFVRSNDSDSLDPQRTVLGDSHAVFSRILDTLVDVNPALEFEPVIAEQYEVSDDGLEYTFVIRAGQKFHDGSDLAASDVKFTFDRAINPDAPSQAVNFIDTFASAELVDDTTVKLILSEPTGPFLSNIAVAYFGILPEAYVGEVGEDYGTQPIGSGPWIFEEWIQGEEITLLANKDYVQVRSFVDNKGGPLADEFKFKTIAETQTQIVAFETGEANIISLPNAEVRNFEDNDDFVILRSDGGSSISAIEFVTLAPEGELGEPIFKPPFDDLRLRQAVAYAINSEEIIEQVLFGLAVRDFGPMPTGLFAYDPAIEEFGYHYDQDMANKLLDEAGWVIGGDGVREKDGAKLDLAYWVWSGGDEERISQVIQNHLGQVGIKMNIETLDIGTVVARLPEAAHNFNWMQVGWPEPDILYVLAGFGWGVGRYHPQDYMDLILKARQTNDQDERTEYYFEAQKLFLEDLPWVPLWTSLQVIGTRAEVKGLKIGALDSIIVDDAWVEE